MTEYLGSSAIISWTSTAGTVQLAADFRTFAYTPTMDKIDCTSGSDTMKAYLTGQKDFTVTYTGVAQNGSAGSAIVTALARNVIGTMTFSPEGTASNAPKYTFPCVSSHDPVISWTYNGLTETSIELWGNGAYSGTSVW